MKCANETVTIELKNGMLLLLLLEFAGPDVLTYARNHHPWHHYLGVTSNEHSFAHR
jgi:hypothetical protein